MKKFFKIGSNKNKGYGSDGPIGRRSSSISSLDFTSNSFNFTSNYPKIDDLLKDKQFTKLHKACYVGDLSKVEKLIKKIDVNEVDSELRTPLHLASSNAHKEVIWFLLGSKAQPNLYDSDGNTPLLKAVQCGHTDIVQFLLDRGGDSKAANKDGDTGLHLATRNGQTDIVMALIQKKAEINARNEEGETPLLVAVNSGQIEISDILLRHGASIHISDNNQRNCLMLACENGFVDLVRLFINEGVDVDASNNLGVDARDIARMSGNDDCVQLIEDAIESQKNRKRKPSTQLENSFSLGIGTPALDSAVFTEDDDDDDDGHSRISVVNSRADFDDADSWNDDDDGSIEMNPTKKENNNNTIHKIGANLSKFMSKIDETASLKSAESEVDNVSPPEKPKRTKDNIEVEKTVDDFIANPKETEAVTTTEMDEIRAKRNRDLMAELGLSDISEFSSSIRSLAPKKDRDEDTDLDVDSSSADDDLVPKKGAESVSENKNEDRKNLGVESLVRNENVEPRRNSKDVDLKVEVKNLKSKESDEESDWDVSEDFGTNGPIHIKPVGLLIAARRESVLGTIGGDEQMSHRSVAAGVVLDDGYDVADSSRFVTSRRDKNEPENNLEDKNEPEDKLGAKNEPEDKLGAKNEPEVGLGDKIAPDNDESGAKNEPRVESGNKIEREDEVRDKNRSEQKKFNTMSSDGTLGRFETMHEVEEVWERNECLDLITDGDNSSSSSKDEGVFHAELACVNSPEHTAALQEEEEEKNTKITDLLWKRIWVQIFGKQIGTSNESDSIEDEASSLTFPAALSDSDKDLPIITELSFTDDLSNSLSAHDDRTFELLATFVRNPTNANRVLGMIQQLRRAWNTELACCKGLTDKITMLESEVKMARTRTESSISTRVELSSNLSELKCELETVKRKLTNEKERNEEIKLILQKKEEQMNNLEEKYVEEVSDHQKTELQLKNFQLEAENAQLLILQSREEHQKELDAIHHNYKTVSSDAANQVEFSVSYEEDLEIIRKKLIREEAARRLAENEVNRLRDQMSNYEARITDESSSKKQIIADLEAKLSVSEEKLRKFQKETSKSAESVLQLELLRQESKASEDFLNKQKEMLQKHKLENERLESELFETKKSLAEARSENLTLKLQLDSNLRLDVARQETETCLQSRWEGILAKFRQDFETTEKIMSEKNISLSKTVSNLQEELNRANERTSVTCKELDTAKIVISQLTAKADKVTADMENNRSKVTELRRNCDDLELRNDELKRQLTEKEAMNCSELKIKEVEFGTGKIKKLEEKLLTFEAKATMAEEELSNFRSDAAKAQQCLRTELLDTTAKVKTAEEQMQNTTRKLMSATNKTQQLEVDLEKKQLELNAANEQILNLTEKLRNSKREIVVNDFLSKPDETTIIKKDGFSIERIGYYDDDFLSNQPSTDVGKVVEREINKTDVVRMIKIEKEIQQLRNHMDSLLKLQRPPDEDVDNLCGGKTYKSCR